MGENSTGATPSGTGRSLDSVVGDCGHYVAGRRQGGRLPVDGAGATAADSGGKGFVWIGLQQPTAEEVLRVAREFGLPALAVEDAVNAHQRPKLELYGDVVFAVLKPVRYVDHVEVVDIAEVAVFLGASFVVTVRHGVTEVLHQVRRELDGGVAGARVEFGAASVLYRAADLVVDGYERAIELMDEDVDEIEAQVFGPGGDDHAERIYKLKSEVAELRRAVVPLGRALDRIVDEGVLHIPAEAAPYFRDVHDHVLRASDAIELVERQLTDVLQANTARVTTGQAAIALRQNEDMRKISSWAAIALVPTAIAGVYGMNFEHMPELTWTFGYPAILLVMVGACVGLWRAFRRNRWL